MRTAVVILRRMTWPWLAVAATAADIRGVTVSTHTWGWEWGSDEMAHTLDVVRELGVNWVSFHPYARIGGDGAVGWRSLDPDAPPAWLARPIREAHARGMKVMVTPHLAYWGSPFDWRGAIRFSDPTGWKRFFGEYRSFVTTLARATREADAFVVGSELDGTVDHESDWRGLIAAVRETFPGPLTYAANWDRFDQVPFWDALDVVGVQAYFPVTADAPPDPVAVRAAWDRTNARMNALRQRTGKHVVFTELGYDAGVRAGIEPWANGEGGSAGEQVQRDCLREAMRAIDREEAVIGAFLWKWFPGEQGSGDFELSRPDVREVIREVWGAR